MTESITEVISKTKMELTVSAPHVIFIQTVTITDTLSIMMSLPKCD